MITSSRKIKLFAKELKALHDGRKGKKLEGSVKGLLERKFKQDHAAWLYAAMELEYDDPIGAILIADALMKTSAWKVVTNSSIYALKSRCLAQVIDDCTNKKRKESLHSQLKTTHQLFFLAHTQSSNKDIPILNGDAFYGLALPEHEWTALEYYKDYSTYILGKYDWFDDVPGDNDLESMELYVDISAKYPDNPHASTHPHTVSASVALMWLRLSMESHYPEKGVYTAANDYHSFGAHSSGCDRSVCIQPAGCGLEYRDEKLIDHTLSTIDQVLIDDPKNPTACFARGYVLYLKARYKEALDDLRAAATGECANWRVDYYSAKVSLLLGNIETARNHYEGCLRSCDSNDRIFDQLLESIECDLSQHKLVEIDYGLMRQLYELRMKETADKDQRKIEEKYDQLPLEIKLPETHFIDLVGGQTNWVKLPMSAKEGIETAEKAYQVAKANKSLARVTYPSFLQEHQNALQMTLDEKVMKPFRDMIHGQMSPDTRNTSMYQLKRMLEQSNMGGGIGSRFIMQYLEKSGSYPLTIAQVISLTYWSNRYQENLILRTFKEYLERNIPVLTKESFCSALRTVNSQRNQGIHGATARQDTLDNFEFYRENLYTKDGLFKKLLTSIQVS